MNYIAVDWGSSNFRALSVRNGEVYRSAVSYTHPTLPTIA